MRLTCVWLQGLAIPILRLKAYVPLYMWCASRGLQGREEARGSSNSRLHVSSSQLLGSSSALTGRHQWKKSFISSLLQPHRIRCFCFSFLLLSLSLLLSTCSSLPPSLPALMPGELRAQHTQTRTPIKLVGSLRLQEKNLNFNCCSLT